MAWYLSRGLEPCSISHLAKCGCCVQQITPLEAVVTDLVSNYSNTLHCLPLSFLFASCLQTKSMLKTSLAGLAYWICSSTAWWITGFHLQKGAKSAVLKLQCFCITAMTEFSGLAKVFRLSLYLLEVGNLSLPTTSPLGSCAGMSLRGCTVLVTLDCVLNTCTAKAAGNWWAPLLNKEWTFRGPKN